MAMTAVDTFLSIALFSFGLLTLLAGAFTAYFGAGKSRRIGVGLSILGLLCVFVWAGISFANVPALQRIFPTWNSLDVLRALVAVVGGVIGAVVALGVFLISIMKA